MREHPLMSYGGIPKLTADMECDDTKREATLNGEIGVLKHLMYYDNSTKILLVINHENQSFVGTLLFSDGRFCDHIATLLKTTSGAQ